MIETIETTTEEKWRTGFSNQLHPGEVLILMTDLTTAFTWHQITTFNELNSKPKVNFNANANNAKKIADSFRYLSKNNFSDESEQAFFIPFAKNIVVPYVASSKTYEIMQSLEKHNVIIVLVDYNKKDSIVRLLGSKHSNTIGEALNISQQLSAALAMNFIKWKDNRVTMF
jgi:hypothetical protein